MLVAPGKVLLLQLAVPTPSSSPGWPSAALAIGSCALCLVVLAYAFWMWRKKPPAFPTKPRDEQRAKALELRIDLAAKLFDIGLLLLGVLWGLVLADKVAIHFSRWTDGLLFISSNVLLLLSLLFHLLYRRNVGNMLWDLVPPPAGASEPPSQPELPDMRHAYVEFPFTVQWLFFFGSLASGLCTILVVKVLGGQR
jgi:hypothetical protein